MTDADRLFTAASVRTQCRAAFDGCSPGPAVRCLLWKLAGLADDELEAVLVAAGVPVMRLTAGVSDFP